VIVDPGFRWEVTGASRVIETARKGEGLAPFVFVKEEPAQGDERRRILEAVGGKLVILGGTNRRWSWRLLLETLKGLGLGSVMVEGGGAVIHDLLAEENLRLIDSVIVTIAPVYLGQGGVGVVPAACVGQDGQSAPAVRFKDVEWCVLERDVIMAARPIP
jgi:2,5-diamino-6-(ribosylamino)-4(3H)-pyrimidinone 5'-phosphate reductase